MVQVIFVLSAASDDKEGRRTRPPQFNLEAIEEFEQQLNAPETTTEDVSEDDLDEFQSFDTENMLTFTVEQE